MSPHGDWREAVFLDWEESVSLVSETTPMVRAHTCPLKYRAEGAMPPLWCQYSCLGTQYRDYNGNSVDVFWDTLDTLRGECLDCLKSSHYPLVSPHAGYRGYEDLYHS